MIATVVGKRRHSDQSGDLGPGGVPEFGQQCGQGDRRHGANAGGGPERGGEVCQSSIDGDLLDDRGLKRFLSSGELGNNRLQDRLGLLWSGGETLDEIGLLGDHQPTRPDQASHLFAGGIAYCGRALRESGSELGDQSGVDRIGLGASALGAGEVADASGFEDPNR
jgi:hypothetical protein